MKEVSIKKYCNERVLNYHEIGGANILLRRIASLFQANLSGDNKLLFSDSLEHIYASVAVSNIGVLKSGPHEDLH